MVIRQVLVVAVFGACSYTPPNTTDATTVPTVAFEFVKSGADEEAGTVMLPVVLSKPSPTVVSASISVLAGGNADELDFEIQIATVLFEPNVTRVMVPVEIKKDFDEDEPDETFTLALSEPRGAELDAAKAIHEVRIADHLLPRVKFLQASITTSTSEGTPSTLTIELTAPSEGESTVTLGVAPGMTNPTDIEDLVINTDTIITIPNGLTQVQVQLGQTDDLLDEEDDEQVEFTLKGASQNLVLGTDLVATHTIQDNDLPPAVEFDVVSSSVDENGGTATIVVRLSAESQRPVSVAYARDGNSSAGLGDATVNGASVAFTPHAVGVPGQTTQSFTVTITDDNVDENAEQVIIDLGTATNATVTTKATHTLTINSDTADIPKIAFLAPSTTHSENTGGVDIRVVLSNPSVKTVSVTYTITGGSATEGEDGADDYQLASPGTVTFPPMDVDQPISVDVRNNAPGNEPDETVDLALSSPSNGVLGTQITHTLTITE